MGVEEHLDNVFKEAAKNLSGQIAGKEYHYRLDPMGYMVDMDAKGREGRCRILDASYSKTYDCNVYRMVDLETGIEFSVDEFEVNLIPA